MNTKQKIYVLGSTVIVAVLVAFTYFYFEAAVHHSITYVWDTWLNTETNRSLVLPLCLALSLAYFGVQHWFDRAAEEKTEHGLGEAPNPTVLNFIKVIGIGFFSLLAGASLGPEAILVPACLIIGGYVGNLVFKSDKKLIGLLSAIGFTALFAAFFHSFIVGLIGLLLVSKIAKVKLTPIIVVLGAIASAVTVWVLSLLSSSPYTTLPPNDWHVSITSLATVTLLLLAGYGTTYLLSWAMKGFELAHKATSKSPWWLKALVAASVLSVLYLMGGSLVEFTGNESIVPMLSQSAALGVSGLVWLAIVKVSAIGWSKTMGYRGGLIFPSIFVASVIVSIAQLITHDTSFTTGLMAVMIGLLAANNKTKILF